MAATPGASCYLVSGILVGCLLVTVQPRQIQHTGYPGTREQRHTSLTHQAHGINNRYLADLAELELRSALEVGPDSNDNPPDIQIYTLTGREDAAIPQNATIGTLVAYISVHDPDSGASGQFTCGFNVPHFELVELGGTVFEVLTTSRFDGDEGARYKLTVQCEDQGDEPRVSSEKLLVIIV